MVERRGMPRATSRLSRGPVVTDGAITFDASAATYVSAVDSNDARFFTASSDVEVDELNTPLIGDSAPLCWVLTMMYDLGRPMVSPWRRASSRREASCTDMTAATWSSTSPTPSLSSPLSLTP